MAKISNHVILYNFRLADTAWKTNSENNKVKSLHSWLHGSSALYVSYWCESLKAYITYIHIPIYLHIIYLHTYIHIPIYLDIHLYTYIYTYIPTYTYLYTYIYTYIPTSTLRYLHIFLYIYLHIHIYYFHMPRYPQIFLHILIYLHTYIYNIHIPTNKPNSYI